VIKRRQKQRLADAARLAKKEAMGDYSHLKNKKGELIAKPLPQPTLPNLSIDDDEPTEVASIDPSAPSYYSRDDYLPPMPSYLPYPGQYPYNPSAATLEDPPYAQPMYDDEIENAHLASSAAPFARSPSPINQQYQPSTYGNWNGDMYQAHAGHVLDTQRRSPGPIQPSNGLIYDDDRGTQRDLERSGTYRQDVYPSQPTTYYSSSGRGYDNGANGGGYAM